MTEPDWILPPHRARIRIGIGAAVVLALVGLAVAVLVSAFGASGVTRDVVPVSPSAAAAGGSTGSDGGAGADVPAQATGPPLLVHVLGAVAAPGLYELRNGDRVVDAVAAAGGFTPEADQGGVNLARPLSDGEQLDVPVVGEAPAPSTAGGATGATGAAGEKVNLNSADEAALDTLPGVGPTTAARILEWREANGRFTSVEDLLSVSGIGDKTFADLKDLVTV